MVGQVGSPGIFGLVLSGDKLLLNAPCKKPLKELAFSL
jgi:hypothetical protein